MLHEGYFDKVYYRFWEVSGSSKVVANIFAIHGLGGHSLWFNKTANEFNKNNINFFSFDLPAFGLSDFPKGTIDSYKIWIDVSKNVLWEFLNKFKLSSPVFILGHSMGALISVLLAKSVRTHGWILSVPGFQGYYETWPLFRFVFPVLFKSIFKSSEIIQLPFGPELITKNKQTQLELKKDPLRVVNCSAKVYFELYLLTLLAKLTNNSFKEPVLFLQAGKDMVCSSKAMDEFFNHIQSKDKVKKVYENSYHDLFIEDEVNEIVGDITTWIKSKI